MDTMTTLQLLTDFFNSGLGFALLWLLMFWAFLWLASKFNPFQEQWKQWEGSIITAIKLAEKQIPDDTAPGSHPGSHPGSTPANNPGSSGLAKLDAALRFVLKAYADANRGKQPPNSMVEQIKQGIQIKHADLERSGALEPRK